MGTVRQASEVREETGGVVSNNESKDGDGYALDGGGCAGRNGGRAL